MGWLSNIAGIASAVTGNPIIGAVGSLIGGDEEAPAPPSATSAIPPQLLPILEKLAAASGLSLDQLKAGLEESAKTNKEIAPGNIKDLRAKTIASQIAEKKAALIKAGVPEVNVNAFSPAQIDAQMQILSGKGNKEIDALIAKHAEQTKEVEATAAKAGPNQTQNDLDAFRNQYVEKAKALLISKGANPEYIKNATDDQLDQSLSALEARGDKDALDLSAQATREIKPLQDKVNQEKIMASKSASDYTGELTTAATPEEEAIKKKLIEQSNVNVTAPTLGADQSKKAMFEIQGERENIRGADLTEFINKVSDTGRTSANEDEIRKIIMERARSGTGTDLTSDLYRAQMNPLEYEAEKNKQKVSELLSGRGLRSSSTIADQQGNITDALERNRQQAALEARINATNTNQNAIEKALASGTELEGQLKTREANAALQAAGLTQEQIDSYNQAAQTRAGMSKDAAGMAVAADTATMEGQKYATEANTKSAANALDILAKQEERDRKNKEALYNEFIRRQQENANAITQATNLYTGAGTPLMQQQNANLRLGYETQLKQNQANNQLQGDVLGTIFAPSTQKTVTSGNRGKTATTTYNPTANQILQNANANPVFGGVNQGTYQAKVFKDKNAKGAYGE